MCCLRYEHDFYVQQRKRFPKEGKLVTTSHGQEKVLANDIFRERVTLRSSEGETRILALEELRREMGGERPAETAEEEIVAPNLEEISDEVIRLQDTVELPAWVPRAGPSTPPGPRSRTLPIAQPGVVERPVAASAAPPDKTDADDGPEDEMEASDASDAGDAGDTGDPSSAASPERRRRRRGRRGGRRNRDARNRREQDKDQGDNAGGAGEPGRDPN
jgi:hypothetical protein